ncbi:hypothetical protein [Marivita hallyeonensis]|uniref:Uncharacterized protein n=1 Tax=Marivita hallyeonensis TaxID=996342 RepID=A0A1M5UR49_9RHOB|nr:hypothetical protein [Marivita hallyeonensis]SHH65517.1 hypothetical protein SAMN05443551_2765 [Marivita hallyeonensis]
MDKPDPEAWGLPGFSFEPIGEGERNTVLRGTWPGAGHVFKSTHRTEEQLRWLSRVDQADFDNHANRQVKDPVTQAAALAFEIATCWCIEPERATRLARDLPRALDVAHSWNRIPDQ